MAFSVVEDHSTAYYSSLPAQAPLLLACSCACSALTLWAGKEQYQQPMRSPVESNGRPLVLVLGWYVGNC